MSGPRVGIGGFLHESNTFLGVLTTYEDFRSTSLTAGPELIERWHGTHHEIGGFFDGADAGSVTPVPLFTYAMPGGTVPKAANERFASRRWSESSAPDRSTASCSRPTARP